MKPNGRDDNEKFVNPKLILRKLSEFLPPQQEDDESWVAQTVQALWAYSTDFITKEELAAGRIEFKADASYSQLGETMRCSRNTAKWRCEQLRDRYQIVHWKRTKYGCDFTLCLQSANPLPDSGGLTDYLSDESSQLTDQSESANEAIESANGGSESANELAPLSLNCRTALSNSSGRKPELTKQTHFVRKDNPNTKSQTLGVSPRTPTGTSRPGTHGTQGKQVAPLQQESVPPAAPPDDRDIAELVAAMLKEESEPEAPKVTPRREYKPLREYGPLPTAKPVLSRSEHKAAELKREYEARLGRKQEQCTHPENPFGGSNPDRCRWCGLSRYVIEVQQYDYTKPVSAFFEEEL